MKKGYLLVLFISFISFAFGQFGNIKGRVVTTDHQPAPYVNVMLEAAKTGTVSDEDGSFIIPHIKEGNYTIVASYVGLQMVRQDIQVSENQTTDINLVLQDSAKRLEEVIVVAKRSHHNTPVSIGKVSIPVMDLPQSITVVGQGTMRDQQAQRLSDVIKNVNGVYLASTRGGTQENFSARGYSFSSSNMFKNGSRVNSGVMPEVSSLESVEVLKGSAAILYGNVAPGGIINMITKHPKFERGGEISMRAGSYDLYKPAVDFYGPLSNKLAYRINGTFESEGSYRDMVSSKRYYINPSLLFKPNNRTEILLQADYLKHNFTPDFGIGTYNNTQIPDVPRSTFYGTPWQYAKTQQTTATASIKHQLKEGWELNSTLSYQQYDRDYYSTERIQALENGDLARPLNKLKTREKYYTGQVNVTGKFTTGNIGHTLLTGIDADRYFTQNHTYDQPAVYDTINIFDLTKYKQRADMPEANEVRLISTPVNRFGVYVQDLIAVSRKIKVLAGIRWSYQNALRIDTLSFADNTHTKGANNKVDKASSPRLGFVYQPSKNTSIFASYSNSFAVNSGTDVYGNALPPSLIDQYELGIKNDLFKGVLSANLTIYRIINNNLAQTAMYAADGITPNSNTNFKELTGQTISDGVELDIAVHPLTGIDVLAGYSYNYIRYTKTPDTKGSYVEGERLINNPASTGNASVFYTFKKGIIKNVKLGGAFFYTGKRFAGFNNTKGQTQTYLRNFTVGGFATVDISAGYTYKKVSILAKIANLTNVYNYYVHENYSINPIPPRQLIATVSYRL